MKQFHVNLRLNYAAVVEGEIYVYLVSKEFSVWLILGDSDIFSCRVRMCVVQYTSPNFLFSTFEKRFSSFDVNYWKDESWNSSPTTLAYIGMIYMGLAAGDEVKIINIKSKRITLLAF